MYIYLKLSRLKPRAIKIIPCETTAQKRRQNTVWKL